MILLDGAFFGLLDAARWFRTHVFNEWFLSGFPRRV